MGDEGAGTSSSGAGYTAPTKSSETAAGGGNPFEEAGENFKKKQALNLVAGGAQAAGGGNPFKEAGENFKKKQALNLVAGRAQAGSTAGGGGEPPLKKARLDNNASASGAGDAAPAEESRQAAGCSVKAKGGEDSKTSQPSSSSGAGDTAPAEESRQADPGYSGEASRGPLFFAVGCPHGCLSGAGPIFPHPLPWVQGFEIYLKLRVGNGSHSGAGHTAPSSTSISGLQQGGVGRARKSNVSVEANWGMQ